MQGWPAKRGSVRCVMAPPISALSRVAQGTLGGVDALGNVGFQVQMARRLFGHVNSPRNYSA